MSSDLDQDAYLELMKESAKSGKSVQTILAERHGHKLPDKITLDEKKEASKEIREFLSKNTWVVKPKQEDSNE